MKMHHLLFAFLAFFASCGNVNDFPVSEREATGTTADNGSDNGDENKEEEEIKIDLNDDIVINETPLQGEVEKTLKPTDGEMYKDFLYNFTYDDETGEYDADYPPATYFNEETQQWAKGVKTLTVTFSEGDVKYSLTSKKGKAATVTAEDFTIKKDGAHLTVTAHTKCNYVLKGTATDGSFKLYTDKKCIITLSDVNLTNNSGAAINIQKGIDGGKRTFLVLANGTKNYLCDGSTYSKKLYPGTTTEEDEKGVIFSEGKICVSGKGYLKIEGKGKNAIACDDYLYMHIGPQITMTPAAGYDGVKAKDGLYIAGGVMNITCSGNAAKGLNTDGVMEVSGGRTTVISTSVPVKNGDDTSKPYCVKCDNALTMSAGALILSASKDGGNGINVKDALSLSGGTIKMVVKETPLTYGTLNKTGGTLYVNGEEK